MAMPVYPIRLDGGSYEKLRARAQREGCTIASLLRRGTDIAVGNPPIDAQLLAIREELIKLSCGIDTNRALLTFLATYLSRGNIDRRELEKILANHDAEMSNRQIRYTKFNDKLRKIARDFPNEEGGKNR